MKIVRSMEHVKPRAVGVVCDWCGEIRLSDEPPRRKKAAFRTTRFRGGDGSQIAADICGGCADQQVRRPNAVLGRLVSEASSTGPKDYTVYRYTAFDIDSNQIVRVQSLIPFSESAP
ncbi:hypothetical protein [uncultured Nevskia sp.]|uniref:hypothetical protein n=1 Tax=uncultured Nevskia sp. TaxID=228950 RepID=UPI0025CF117E|nr:hypothetical protein [uncultured Nevskia sp.]